MKKIYTLLILFVIAGIVGVFVFTKTNNKKIQLGETFTPQEYWDYQYAVKKEKRKNGYNKADKPDEFTKYFKAITTKFGQSDNQYAQNYRMSELNKAKSKKYKGNQPKFTVEWTQRGPGNVGGRTRGIVVDPDDATHNTWFAGAATGGIWKTTDGGANWTCLTDEFPNLSANTLAMAGSDHNIIYAGTGESFPGGTYMKGSGVFKSVNKGADWVQLATTANNDDFAYVNRLIINPTNADIIIAATESGIMKSVDGGATWNKVYSSNTGVEDIRMDPTDFNKLYAAENSVGVVKSIDAGDSWIVSSSGIASGDRFEIAVSPVDPSIIFASANISSTESYVYRSIDFGNTWTRFEEKYGVNRNFLGGQGTYDNTLSAHPYDKDVAFVGGVNLWKVDFSDPGTIVAGTPTVLRVDQINTQSFLTFVNFGGTYLGGGMETGDKNNAINLVSADWASVEVRFGPGIKQKAHRFTVGGLGSGVPVSGYLYQDYVDVPFQVWDVTNNRQLMASFRDQDEDGKFNLYDRTGLPDTQGREYLFVNAVEYSETTASTDIAKTGGHTYKELYFFWPTLLPGAPAWDENNLPVSKLSIQYGSLSLEKGTITNVSDAYGSYSGNNTYNQGAGMGGTVIPGLHPDHHALEIVPIDQAKDSFLIINGNDGGLAISKNSGIKFTQMPNNYITTQFYGVAKKPGANEFIGGMQDNGTWRSQAGQDATSSSQYLFQIGGDGFECMWHYSDPNKIIGSVYYNSFYRTTNGGSSWSSAVSGITTNDGPFITRISSHKNTPDNLYAVGKSGLYKSTNFGQSWTTKNIGTGWLGTNGTAVTSQHSVEVSLANENIIWAGAAMAEDYGFRIFVSTNQGETFTAVPDFADADMSGYISGIATHPFEDSTAYILFSFANEPKVLRTKDLGQTWEDISGFVGSSSSTNGFPDVVTHSLIVLPNDPSTIWVGTDIGLFESTDDGATWHYADNGLPAVSIYDMFVQDNKVVIGTHGRGIWTASIDELNFVPEISALYNGQRTINASVNFVQAVDSVEIYVNNVFANKLTTVIAGTNNITAQVLQPGIQTVNAIGYKNGTSYQSNNAKVSVSFNPELIELTKPETNVIRVKANLLENYDSLQVYANNNLVKSVTDLTIGDNLIDFRISASGSYTVYVKGYYGSDGYSSGTKSVTIVYVGINNPKNKSLEIYPNPSNGVFRIDLPAEKIENSTLEVYSLSGSKVYSRVITESSDQIDLSNLNSGTYLIKLSKDGVIYSEKIQIRK